MKNKGLALFFAIFMIIGVFMPTEVSAAEYYSPVTIKTNYDYNPAYLVTDDGQVYYLGYDSNYPAKDIPPYIFTLDDKGKITHSAQLSFNWASIRFKQTGNNICVMYNIMEKGVIKKCVCERFDKNLKNIGKYDLSAFGEYFDMSDDKIAYYKSGKIYLCDLDGKNKKAAVDLTGKFSNTTIITSIAVNDKYISYTLKDTSTSNMKYYMGYYSIKTGKGKIWKSDLVMGATAFGNNMLYYSHVRNTKSDYSWGQVPVMEGSGKYVAIINGKIKTIKTTDSLEPAKGGVITDDGKIISWSSHKNSKGRVDGIYIRIYENGKLVSEKVIKDLINFMSMYANGGKLVVNYETKENGKRVVRAVMMDY